MPTTQSFLWEMNLHNVVMVKGILRCFELVLGSRSIFIKVDLVALRWMRVVWKDMQGS